MNNTQSTAYLFSDVHKIKGTLILWAFSLLRLLYCSPSIRLNLSSVGLIRPHLTNLFCCAPAYAPTGRTEADTS